MYCADGEAQLWETIKFHGRKAKFCVSATEKNSWEPSPSLLISMLIQSDTICVCQV